MSTAKTPRPLEVKKLENGTLAVRWSTSPKRWAIIEDETLAAFVIWRIVNAEN